MPKSEPPSFERVDLGLLAMPPRSRLFNLEPIGIGTPYVESLISYVVRESEAHCVLPRSLSESRHLATGRIVIHWSHDQTLQDR